MGYGLGYSYHVVLKEALRTVVSLYVTFDEYEESCQTNTNNECSIFWGFSCKI